MIEKRFINDVTEVLDTWFGYMGKKEPTEREIKEKDYLLIGVARSQRDAESICEKLNEQNKEIERLKLSNKLLRVNRKDCEKGRINERKSFEKFDKSRVEHIRFLQKRLKENGLSIYMNE